jgi:ribose 5-phosphate isomerase A
MDLKQIAALEASTMIPDNSIVGLGDGSSIRLLAGFLKDAITGGLHVSLYTSSVQTEVFLQEAGITVQDISQADSLDLYFDGCDQIDHQFNALKSGAGIHTQEKLLASMAKKFIILADDSKYTSVLDPRFPLVLEILPQAAPFVMKKLKNIFGEILLSIRTIVDEPKKPQVTRNGNWLVDCRFPQWPQPVFVQEQCKQITGVVEISLFYKMVHEAVIAGNQGVRRILKE